MFGTDKSALWDVQHYTPSFRSDIHAAKLEYCSTIYGGQSWTLLRVTQSLLQQHANDGIADQLNLCQ